MPLQIKGCTKYEKYAYEYQSEKVSRNIAVWLRPTLSHLERNASWSSSVYKAVYKPPPRNEGAALSLCTISLPSYSLASLLPLTLHFGTVCTLRAAQGLKGQLCLVHVLSRTGKKTDGSLSNTPETSQPGILQFRFAFFI